MNHASRRDFLIATGAAGAMFASAKSSYAAPTARVSETKVISQQPRLYCGWPTLAQRANGELLLVYSGGREAHVCPFGRVELMRSHDAGDTWTFPRTVFDGPIDDRDAGIVETHSGALLVTTFTSLAYEPILQREEKKQAAGNGSWSDEKLARWRGAHNRISEEQRKKELGVWMLRSTDGGVSWSKKYDCLVDSPHGPVRLDDGRMLYAGKDLWREGARVGVCESVDDGVSWRWLAEIPTRKGDDHNKYHELHAVDAGGGRIVVHIRNHNQKNAGETLQCVSNDGGRTWSEPRTIGVWGLPSHLLRLRNGSLLMTYGHRRKPYGNQARLSTNRGDTWSESMLVSADGVSGDLGYPSTVELADGSLLSAWYENMAASDRSVLRQAHWKIEM